MISNSDLLLYLSPALANDLESIQARPEAKPHSINAHTFYGYRKGLINGLRHWPSERKELLVRLISQGIRSLDNKNYWIDLEISSKSMLDHEISVAFTRSLFALFKLSINQPALERIGSIRFGEKNVSILEIYAHSRRLGEELNRAFEKLKHSSERTNETKANVANNVISFIKFIEVHGYRCQKLEDIYVLCKSGALGNEFPTTRRSATNTSFNALMYLHNPIQYKKDIIQIGGRSVDITAAVRLSPVFRDQLEKVGRSDHMRGVHGHKDRANVNRLSSILRTIIKLCKIDHEFSKEFHDKGLDCLAINSFSLLKSVSSKIKSREVNELKRLYAIHSGKNISKNEVNEYVLSFAEKKSGHIKNIDAANLLLLGKKFVEDIIDLHKNEIFLNDQKNYAVETLYTRFSVLMKMAKYISKEATKKFGLRFLSERDGKYQVELLSRVQTECLNKAISRRTAEGVFSCVRWLCQITNQPFINSYRITSNRHATHAARLSTKDTYSLEEVRELAFYIEKSIAKGATSPKNLLALHFAKIQIKTCLNTASLITVECTDIQQFDIPTKDKPITVLIQKPRKGYKTDYFKFDPKFPKSAIHDLLYVRDQLTSTVRNKFSNNMKSERLFIYEEVGQLKSLTNTRTVPNIARLLVKVGCSVKYNSAKLRKTGANEVYRQLAKDISRYKDALKHSYGTFVKHYQRINEAKQKLNLQNATETMDKYFTGREISSEIKIVTEYSKSTQLTPLGGCTSKIGSKEALAYNKSHASLDRSTPLRCGDFLACVWCKYYRVVADASHIWQLLSFKKFVLSSMESSVAHFSDTSTQKQAIEALNYRVDSIVNTIKSINSSAVHEGETLMHTKGMHPDWEFALPTLRLTL